MPTLAPPTTHHPFLNTKPSLSTTGTMFAGRSTALENPAAFLGFHHHSSSHIAPPAMSFTSVTRMPQARTDIQIAFYHPTDMTISQRVALALAKYKKEVEQVPTNNAGLSQASENGRIHAPLPDSVDQLADTADVGEDAKLDMEIYGKDFTSSAIPPSKPSISTMTDRKDAGMDASPKIRVWKTPQRKSLTNMTTKRKARALEYVQENEANHANKADESASSDLSASTFAQNNHYSSSNIEFASYSPHAVSEYSNIVETTFYGCGTNQDGTERKGESINFHYDVGHDGEAGENATFGPPKTTTEEANAFLDSLNTSSIAAGVPDSASISGTSFKSAPRKMAIGRKGKAGKMSSMHNFTPSKPPQADAATGSGFQGFGVADGSPTPKSTEQSFSFGQVSSKPSSSPPCDWVDENTEPVKEKPFEIPSLFKEYANKSSFETLVNPDGSNWPKFVLESHKDWNKDRLDLNGEIMNSSWYTDKEMTAFAIAQGCAGFLNAGENPSTIHTDPEDMFPFLSRKALEAYYEYADKESNRKLELLEEVWHGIYLEYQEKSPILWAHANDMGKVNAMAEKYQAVWKEMAQSHEARNKALADIAWAIRKWAWLTRAVPAFKRQMEVSEKNRKHTSALSKIEWPRSHSSTVGPPGTSNVQLSLEYPQGLYGKDQTSDGGVSMSLNRESLPTDVTQERSHDNSTVQSEDGIADRAGVISTSEVLAQKQQARRSQFGDHLVLPIWDSIIKYTLGISFTAIVLSLVSIAP
ncbi:uncharacterized protein BDZ99DRAFT_523820 [Mytilinidion resinicola]|uniref:Uncharacterized protein n=1 Tax=Mytilinidion resinicola TaxID=574789 RepID=A0A6A6YCS2_9PEZI|nr:uncharacterized protein BDZ99DRAFT_523820 [Mytilinidion resinicola]KAF2806368.1 hypothetical protein BDZ99DRAFT_523820 [Mytilinidion resinicola]